ncbi:MAG: molybdopterin-binding protein [Pseudonocardiales bacterium]|nr:MAG: molybdopterin-binding protein [Pseudonocardiales bacterium]
MFWPKFSSPLHSPAVIARVGRVLGIVLALCFVTGLLSHYQYHPWHWLPEPASPVWGYRLSQGLHVMTGIAAIPLLLVKLWAVYPKFFEWPPARSVLHGLERISIAILVSTALLELVTGFLNILNWYPWPWGFVFVHYALAYAVMGSIILHIAVKLPVIREGLATKISQNAPPPAAGEAEPESESETAQPAAEQELANATTGHGLSRRGLLIAGGAGVGVVAATTLGQVIPPLEPLALLAPRKVSDGPLGVPINRTAKQAGTTKSAADASWRLTVIGPNPYDLDLAALEALPAADRHFPIACVEGWSVGADWRGPLLVDVLRKAGVDVDGDIRVHVQSLEREGTYNNSIVEGHQLPQALLATHLNGKRLSMDHGFPLRLIAPDRAGVLNTKWIESVRVI